MPEPRHFWTPGIHPQHAGEDPELLLGKPELPDLPGHSYRPYCLFRLYHLLCTHQRSLLTLFCKAYSFRRPVHFRSSIHVCPLPQFRQPFYQLLSLRSDLWQFSSKSCVPFLSEVPPNWPQCRCLLRHSSLRNVHVIKDHIRTPFR